MCTRPFTCRTSDCTSASKGRWEALRISKMVYSSKGGMLSSFPDILTYKLLTVISVFRLTLGCSAHFEHTHSLSKQSTCYFANASTAQRGNVIFLLSTCAGKIRAQKQPCKPLLFCNYNAETHSRTCKFLLLRGRRKSSWKTIAKGVVIF
ncbi:unnamed protein product [Ixodes pacificus]